MSMRILTALGAALLLVSCGGGGGGSSSAGPSPADIQALTGLASPAEVPQSQGARSAAIVSRADSLVSSTIFGETSLSQLPRLTVPSSCSGTRCTFREPTTGASISVSLSDFEAVTGSAQAVGTKHGITLVKSAGRHEGSDFTSFGAWMQHSAFAAQTERLTVSGVSVNGRYGIAGGDLTRSRPLGSAAWLGLMVGTPARGAGQGERLQGDAALTYDLRSRSLGAAFTNIQNIDQLQTHSVSAVRFSNIPVDSQGRFQAGRTGNRIQGGFYSPAHAEAAGVFEQSNIDGAFGANRQ